MSPKSELDVTIRPAAPEDSAICGQICYDAFSSINAAHGFPCDFPGPEATTSLLSMMFSSPGFYCVVAEVEGRIVGSNCLDERSLIAGVGPITVDPSAQNLGIGRKLMQAVMDRANGTNRRIAAGAGCVSQSLVVTLHQPGLRCPGAPLLHAGTNARTELFPDVLCGRHNPAIWTPATHYRGECMDSIEAPNWREAIQQNTAMVVERGGRITGYASALAFFGHATAETNLDMQSLIASAESFGGPGILVPSRNSALLRWCLANGLRVVQPMTLMSIGLYNEPTGAWLPSILF